MGKQPAKPSRDLHVRAYDFDGTLIKGDSFLLFPLYALSPFRVLKAVLKSIPVIFSMLVLKSIDASEAKERLFSNLFKGVSVKEMKEKAEKFADVLDKRLLAPMHDKRFLSGRVQSVIVSASPGFWIRPWASRHGFEDVISTEAEVENGRFSGKFATPNCKGDEKVRRLLEKYPDKDSIVLEAWGNSKDDLPMLNFADIAHYVGKLRTHNI